MELVLTLAISSLDEAKVSDQEAKDLYLELVGGLNEGQVQPWQGRGVADHRGFDDSFRLFILTGINFGVFAGMFEILKTWLQARSTCEITLKYPDGSELKISNLSLEAAQSLHQQHVLRLAATAPADKT